MTVRNFRARPSQYAANRSSAIDDASADAGSEGEADHQRVSPAGTGQRFPQGVGRRVVVERHRQPEHTAKQLGDSDSPPALEVGGGTDDPGRTIDKPGNANADRGHLSKRGGLTLAEGDFDGSGRVDFSDFIILATNFGT